MNPILLKKIEAILTNLSSSHWNSWDKTIFSQRSEEYSSYFYALKNAPSLTAFCKTLNAMISKNLYPNPFIFRTLIIRFGSIDLQCAFFLHRLMIQHDLDNSFSYCAVLDSIMDCQSPDQALALSLFETASDRHLLDPFIVVKTLVTIGKSVAPDANLIHNIFKQAQKLNLINPFVFSSTLSALAKTPSPPANLIINLLNEAETHKCANEIAYSAAIDAISRGKDPDLDYMLKLLARMKIQYWNCTFAYGSVINALMKKEQLKEANQLFQEALKSGSLKLPKIKKHGENYRINFHRYTYGTAYLSLNFLLEKLTLKRVSIICGQDLHRKLYKKNAESEVRQAVKRVLFEKKIKHTNNRENPGMIDVQLSQELPNHHYFKKKKPIGFFAKKIHTHMKKEKILSHSLSMKL